MSAIFSTVRDASANVIMISQASSEHSVCFAVKQAQGEQAVAALNARCAAWELRAHAGAWGQDEHKAFGQILLCFLCFCRAIALRSASRTL